MRSGTAGLALAVAVAVVCAVGGTDAARAAFKLSSCNAPGDVVRLNVALPATARAVGAGKALVIVAIGSSSTEGVGASDADHSYPARLERELARRWPGVRLTVINRGVGGETAGRMLARFDADVLPHAPQLVIWQVGSNSILKGVVMDRYVAVLREGIARLRAAGSDVILMDPQYAPVVIARPQHRRMVDAMRGLAEELKVGLFRRFAVMRHWAAQGGMTIEDFFTRDRLHMNDASYGCLARLLAEGIAAAVGDSAAPDAREDATADAMAAPRSTRPSVLP